jgi:hypothetical protein
MSEEQIETFALGAYAFAPENNTLASRNASWIVDGENFQLLIGDANLTTTLDKSERIMLKGICERLFIQAQMQENRL